MFPSAAEPAAPLRCCSPGSIFSAAARTTTTRALPCAYASVSVFHQELPARTIRLIPPLITDCWGLDRVEDLAQMLGCMLNAGSGVIVPMGGDLSKGPAGKSPSFLVAALKDTIGANLDRVQVVKGWIDAKGDLQEKVYDVVWSGDRKAGADGKVASVGSTVDVADATYMNSIGAPELITVWTDPNFDPAIRAFYYARFMMPAREAQD